MVVGVGIDLVHVLGLKAQLEDHASHFLAATFTPAELAYAQSAVSQNPTQHLAARYAAKEAAIKAFDYGCAQVGLKDARLKAIDIEVKRDGEGRSWLALHGDASKLAERLGADRTWVSLSHDGDYASAVVVLERLG